MEAQLPATRGAAGPTKSNKGVTKRGAAKHNVQGNMLWRDNDRCAQYENIAKGTKDKTLM